MKTKFNLHVVLVKENEGENITAFVVEMPEVIAEGKTHEEAISNLKEAYDLIQSVRMEEEQALIIPNDYSKEYLSFSL